MIQQPEPWARTVFEAQHRIWPGWRGSVGEAPQTAAFITRSLALEEGARVLDAGGGSGRESSALFEAGFSVATVDWSHELLRMAVDRIPSAAAVCADLRRLPFPRGSFDAAFLWDSTLAVLEASDAAGALDEIVDVVRPGGGVLVEQMTLGPYLEPLSYSFGPDEMTAGHTTRTYRWDAASGLLIDAIEHLEDDQLITFEQQLALLTGEELCARLEGAGLVNVQLTGSDGWDLRSPGAPVMPSSRRISAVGWRP